MAESFFDLPDEERRKILNAMAAQLGRRAHVLEKDVWVCWALQQLWATPGAVKMAFKGGTSLSKVYDAIARFSEDIDVTFDYRALDPDFDPFADGTSRNKLNKASDRLKGLVRDYSHDVVVPHLKTEVANLPVGIGVEASDDGETVRIMYRSAVEGDGDYVTEGVLLEFGGRNITDPCEAHIVTPDLAAHVDGLVFPSAKIDVLSGGRTFWEKATMMHVECNRAEFKVDASRLSRHWYDVASLADHDVGRRALEDRELLADVVRHKKAFFHASYANYDACLVGGMRLLPDEPGQAALGDDYARMQAAGMFFDAPPTWDEIVARLGELQQAVNGAYTASVKEDP